MGDEHLRTLVHDALITDLVMNVLIYRGDGHLLLCYAMTCPLCFELGHTKLVAITFFLKQNCLCFVVLLYCTSRGGK
jgi:hypothetical protein